MEHIFYLNLVSDSCHSQMNTKNIFHVIGEYASIADINTALLSTTVMYVNYNSSGADPGLVGKGFHATKVHVPPPTVMLQQQR